MIGALLHRPRVVRGGIWVLEGVAVVLLGVDVGLAHGWARVILAVFTLFSAAVFVLIAMTVHRLDRKIDAAQATSEALARQRDEVEAPTGLRAVRGDGDSLVLAVEYLGVDEDGLHAWRTTPAVPAGWNLEVDTLPGRTAVYFTRAT